MSLLRYGPVTLNFVTMRSFQKEAVYNGPDYLYTEYTLEMEAIFNPATQSDFIPGLGEPFMNSLLDPTLGIPFVPPLPIGVGSGGFPADPTFGQIDAGGNPSPLGSFPSPAGPRTVSPPSGPTNINPPLPVPGAVSAQAVENVLLRPRYFLQYSVGGVVVLESPLRGYPVDSTNGPYPLSCKVEQISGAKTFRVLYAIKTALNEQSLFTCCDPLVLSHTFSKTHTLDQQWFARVSTKGRVVFNGPVVERGQNAVNQQEIDDLRFLFIPITSPGCIRESVQVTAEDDGLTMNYEVVDRELPIKWNTAGIVRVEAFHSFEVTKKNQELMEQAADFDYQREVLANSDVVPRSFNPLDLPLEKAGKLQEIGKAWLKRTRITQKEIEYFSLPVYLHSISIDVWGDQTTTRVGLTTFAQSIANIRLGVLRNFGKTVAGYNRKLVHSIHDKHIHLEHQVITGPLDNAVLTASGWVLDPTSGTPPYFGIGDSTGIFLINDPTTPKRVVMPSPSGDGRGRGSLLERAVASALEDEFEPNIPVPNPTNTNPLAFQRIASCCPPCGTTEECDPDPDAACPTCPPE